MVRRDEASSAERATGTAMTRAHNRRRQPSQARSTPRGLPAGVPREVTVVSHRLLRRFDLVSGSTRSPARDAEQQRLHGRCIDGATPCVPSTENSNRPAEWPIVERTEGERS